MKAYLSHCRCQGDTCTCDDGRHHFPQLHSKDNTMSPIDKLTDAINALSDKDRAALDERLNARKILDMKAVAQNKRIDRVLASARDEKMQVAMKVALRGLRRVGLDIEKLAAAADPLSVINEAFDRAKFSASERMQLKTVLANIGCLD
jgi:hypothetical protein